jgi:hypothetical protein
VKTTFEHHARVVTLNLLRIVTGLLFAQHGVQKLFGWLGGRQVESLVSLHTECHGHRGWNSKRMSKHPDAQTDRRHTRRRRRWLKPRSRRDSSALLGFVWLALRVVELTRSLTHTWRSPGSSSTCRRRLLRP